MFAEVIQNSRAMLNIPKRIAIFMFSIILGMMIIFIIIVGPANALAQVESKDLTSPAMFSYCSGFTSHLASYSVKEKALFLYHQHSVLDWDADVSFQAGVISSGRLLEEFKRGANERELRIVISRVVGELCGFASDEHNLMHTISVR